MPTQHFTEEIDVYTVLILKLSDYMDSQRPLPDGFQLARPDQYQALRRQEKHALQQIFDDWDIPYCHKMPGWRSDSSIFLISGDQLVGGLYLCGQNEFHESPQFGQLHYAFLLPKFQGLGLYRSLFREAVNRATVWGLTHVYLNSDRYLLPEVYVRWGAQPYKKISKPAPRLRVGRYQAPDWAYRILRLARRKIRLAVKSQGSPCD